MDEDMKSKSRVLFVCMGNICRSPTAEGVFIDIVNRENLRSDIQVDSAGTHAYHVGNSPDKRAIATAKHHGVDLSTLVARKVTQKDFIDFDYIIAMDEDNLSNLKEIHDGLISSNCTSELNASLHLFMTFSQNWSNDEVPDPYYGGDNGFEEVYKMVVDASEGLLKHIENFSKK